MPHVCLCQEVLDMTEPVFHAHHDPSAKLLGRRATLKVRTMSGQKPSGVITQIYGSHVRILADAGHYVDCLRHEITVHREARHD